MPAMSVRRANAADRLVMERLWLMFRHDLSEFRSVLPDSGGGFRDDRLRASFRDPDWSPYLVTGGESPVGMALVRGLSGSVRVLSEFFIVRGARRAGVGLSAAREVLARHPGPWEIAFQDDNVPAARFWRRLAADVSGDAWTEEKRPVPGRDDLPPDVWIRFEC
ncbi:GNAT family N-acetyltransferase [Actinomadura syzygii]|uniref:GNAT family N-acetyltransferase n=2 Tax=Actinomadura syzygii TaxID=1427538 RepID=A0A5D0UM34_9ACTN|nr:GNAT family N-acetyltransferase [Actinomadura syzygii]